MVPSHNVQYSKMFGRRVMNTALAQSDLLEASQKGGFLDMRLQWVPSNRIRKPFL